MNRAALGLRLFPDDQKAVILHADDVGMCHGANAAFLELRRLGAITCGSVMMPCPFAPEIARVAAAEPELDLGVHLTLTSEWPGYRWGPLTRAGAASGLVDREGYFPRTVAELATQVEPEAAEAEMHAQVERALTFGLDITHLDAHMGAALLPKLLPAYLRVGRAHRLPVLLPRRSATYRRVLKLDPLDAAAALEAAVAEAGAAGIPLIDDFAMTPDAAPDGPEAAYRALVDGLDGGVTFLALHPNTPGEIEAIAPHRAPMRIAEHALLRRGAVAAWLDRANIRSVGMRPFREALRGCAEQVPVRS